MIAAGLREPWHSVERLSIVTPLGIRFWDPAYDVAVDDRLIVVALPFGADRPATTGLRTSSGVYAFHGLPGLHDLEYPRGDQDSPGSLPATVQFQIVVSDTAARFLPASFAVDVPFRGIYPTDLPAPGAAGLPGFYLFSAPTREATPLLAAVRAQLSERLDETTERPAAHAVLQIDAPHGDTWVGVADERGAVAVLFPYPTFAVAAGGSLASLAPNAIPQQNWPLTLRVLYQPSALSFPVGTLLPELRSVLAQAPAAIWTQRLAPPGEVLASLPATLVFGQELIVRSGSESVLMVGLGSLP